MKCKEVESYIIDYLDNNLEKTKKDNIEKHLESCERCLDMVKDYKKILDTMETAGSEPEQPDESLRVNFYHMLHTETRKQQKTMKLKTADRMKFTSLPYLKYAAGVALLIAGTIIGMFLNDIIYKSKETVHLTELESEVQNIKEMLVYSMLKEESSSRRIQAMGYIEEMQAPDEKVFNALIETLNNDKNVNVRLTAAYSLANYIDNKSVRDSLVNSLSKQTEPIIQVVLINILVEKKVNTAREPIQKIISNENTLKDVKDVAQKGLEVLL